MTVVEVEPDLPSGEMLPPQDLAAERAVLGACMLNRRALEDASEFLRPGDFYRPAHELVWDAMRTLLDRGDPVDQLTVSDELRDRDQLRRAGGVAYMFDLVTAAPVASAVECHAQIVADRAVRRRMVEAGHRIVQMGYEDAGSTADVVAAGHTAMDGVQVRRRDVGSHESDVYAAVDALDETKGTKPLKTPWADLTGIVGGWRPGNLYYVGARPGLGKTIIGIAAALDAARMGRRALICSLEMSRNEIYHRMLSSVGSVDSSLILHRRLAHPDWQKVADAAAHIASLPLAVDDDPLQSVHDIRARARRLARDGLGLVVVDYLQLMSTPGRSENRQTEIAGISRALKLMARELEVPVVAMSQLNRSAESRADKRPHMADFRESGSLEQDADAVLLLHRDPDVPDELELAVAKNRHGVSGTSIRLHWEGHYSRVTEWPARVWSPSAAASA